MAVETGAGASSLACAYYALKYDGLALSWDSNGEKGSLIRTVCTETMGNVFAKHVDTHWKLVAHDSLSPYLGLPILPDLVDHVDLFFHDSEHTWNTVLGELKAVNPLLVEGAVVALDDANQDYLHTNIAYINTFRRKLGLPPVPRPQDNTSLPFYQETERFLQANWGKVDYLPDLYKQNVRNDPYFAYFDAEFDIKVELGTERLEKLEHRFDSWRVSKRLDQTGKP
ncbi:MAG: class I SAM-dependent methyltransferase [Gammaproteobacteria bacterium]|nr:class I SAM-dependent methyltransferase [Gammaproteobacteria bacterium]